MTATAVNFSHICLTEKQQMMHGTELEYNLQRYMYPTIALFGILGNVLNLTVLLNKSMRSRANTFLAVLAFADIIFLSLLFPNILANYSIFTYSYYFRWFYYNSKVHLISLANWCSAIAIWCVIAVCADRLVGIRNPLYIRGSWPCWKLPLLICSIVALTGLLTFYQHFEYSCLVRSYCNNTQLYSRCLPITTEAWFGNRENPFTQFRRNLISTCVMLYPILMIICPIILLAILNMMLICALRDRQKNLVMGEYGENPARTSKSGSSAKRPPELTNFQKTEHRVTLTVTFIVTMFTITNGPSALEHLLRKTYQLKQQDYYDATMICTTLVIFGKASNFILFCLGSKHFRLRLIRLTQKKVNKKIENFSQTFLNGRTPPGSQRRKSIPSGSRATVIGPEDLRNNRSDSKTTLLNNNNKQRVMSKPSLTRDLPPFERIQQVQRGRSQGSIDLHKPLIASNSSTTND